MNRTLFCGELFNHKVLPKDHLIEFPVVRYGKVESLLGHASPKKVRSTITRRGFISDCKTLNLLLIPNNIWHEVLEWLNKILLHQTIVELMGKQLM